MYYIHTDHLGSINVITNQSGAIIKNYSFDTWGRRRNPADWTYTNIPSTFLFSREFTKHVRETQFLRASANQKLIVERIPTVKHVGKHLDQFALINMNGRIYDPIIARFLNPDNIVQMPDFTQSFNRYTYCLNNPLKYIDPSGYSYLAPNDPGCSHVSFGPPDPVKVYFEALSKGYEGSYQSFLIQFWDNYGSATYGYNYGSVGEGSTSMTFTWQERVDPPFEPKESTTQDPNTGIVSIAEVPIYPPQYVTRSVTITVNAQAQSGGDDNKGSFIDISFNRGIPQIETNFIKKDWGAVTPGPVVIYPRGGAKNPYYNTHEPGHVIQFLILGPVLYLDLVAIPSLITSTTPYHKYMPWEESANQLWYWLTGENDPRNPLYFGPKKK